MVSGGPSLAVILVIGICGAADKRASLYNKDLMIARERILRGVKLISYFASFADEAATFRAPIQERKTGSKVGTFLVVLAHITL